MLVGFLRLVCEVEVTSLFHEEVDIRATNPSAREGGVDWFWSAPEVAV